MNQTAIAWTDATANFWLGCHKVSPGCKHCYAERLVKRTRPGLWGPAAYTRRYETTGVYNQVATLQRQAAKGRIGVLGEGYPLTCFVGSLMDWAEDHPDLPRIRQQMWIAIRAAPDVHFQLLTKRADRIAECLPDNWGEGWNNVWLGVSVEDDRVLDRISHLMLVPAAVRFVSYEPALGPMPFPVGIDWIIYGGESGPRHRPEDKRWARDMRYFCDSYGTPFFHKQSAGERPGTGVELEGEIIQQFPHRKLHQRAPTLF